MERNLSSTGPTSVCKRVQLLEIPYDSLVTLQRPNSHVLEKPSASILLKRQQGIVPPHPPSLSFDLSCFFSLLLIYSTSLSLSEGTYWEPKRQWPVLGACSVQYSSHLDVKTERVISSQIQGEWVQVTPAYPTRAISKGPVCTQQGSGHWVQH